MYRETEESPWKTIMITDFKEQFAPMFFTFDNKNLIGVSNIGRDKSAIVELNLSTKTEKILYENPDFDVEYVAYSRLRKVLTAAIYTSWKTERYYFDTIIKNQIENIEQQLPGYEISITG